ncbi:MAG TPA: MFS transporter [Vicinamibacteria bacterium]|nr:MFS transporter [Vicinamibacteria bacterium]
MSRTAAWSLLALAGGHFATDCCSGIWPVFKTVAHLDLALAGLIATVSSMAGNGLQLAFGAFADRDGRKRLLVIGVASAAAVTFVPWARGSYLVMALLVMAAQIGSAAFHPAAAGAASSLSRRRAGFLLGLFFAGGYLGYSLSQFLFTAVYHAAARATPLIAVSALLMGLPWVVATLGPLLGGLLADPARGGTPARALGWFALLIPLALLAARFVRPRAEDRLPA